MGGLLRVLSWRSAIRRGPYIRAVQRKSGEEMLHDRAQHRHTPRLVQMV
jgi:hypothetical protein